MNAHAPSPSTVVPSYAERLRTIGSLALPIMGGMISQNVLNLIDTWMVGKKGAAALAAVSSAGMVHFAFAAGMMGLSAGVQALSARRHGELRLEETAAPLNGALILALAFGIPVTACLVPLIPLIFSHLNPDPAVREIGIPYLTARATALCFAGVNFSFRGYWNGTGRPQLYFITLLVIHAANIFLNWLLIFGNWGFPECGAVGAGIASASATGLGTLCYLYLGVTRAAGNGFLRALPTVATLRSLTRLALPTCVQQGLFACGFIALFWILGLMGTVQTAAAGVLINLMLVAVLPALALGITATSLVGQALGRKAPREAVRWGWEVVRVSLLVSAVLSVPMLVFTDTILGAFLSNPQAVEMARWPLRIFALGIWLDSSGTVLQQALLGAGANRGVMLVSVVAQWGLFLPAAYVIGPVFGFGLAGIWAAQAAYRATQALVYGWMWRSENWTRIEL
jgi:putative MATE family efflux protein